MSQSKKDESNSIQPVGEKNLTPADPPKIPSPNPRDYIGPLSKSISYRLVNVRWALLGIAVVLAVLAFLFSRQLDFNRSIESMFASDDPVLEPYRRLKEQFGGNEIVLAVYQDENLLAENGDGIRRLKTVTNQLKSVEGVQGVLSLAELNAALENLYGLAKNPVRMLQLSRGRGDQNTAEKPANTKAAANDPSDAASEDYPIVNVDDSLALEFREMFEGFTHSTDGKTVAIACILESRDVSGISRRKVVDDLREIISVQDGQLTGEPAMVADGFRYVERDGRSLGVNCLILMSLVIIGFFRSLRWVIIPLAVTLLTLWMTRATLVLVGFQMSMVSSMLTAIVTVIAVATSMHVILRFREARLRGDDKVEAMKCAIGILFWPILWACLTDAAGFAALLIAEVGPVQDFGVMMAIASVLVFVSILLLVIPLGLLGELDTDPKRAWGEGRMGSALQHSTSIIASRPGWLAAAIFVFAAFLSCGNLFLKVETDFTKNFRSNSPIAKSYMFVEQNLGGAGVIDVILPAPKSLSREYFSKVMQFENELRKIQPLDTSDRQFALTKVISLADVDAASTNVLASKLPFFADNDALLQLRLSGMKNIMPNLFDSLYSKEVDENGFRYYRVMLRTSQQQSAEEKQALIGKIQRLAKEQFPPATAQTGPETTGFFVLLSNLVRSILKDQYWTFGLAVIGIATVMLIAFRNLKLALIAMVPNLLPVMVVMGSLGWAGIKINMGAAMIAAVSLGLSIDSSIHYLWAYQRWREIGLDRDAAIVEVQMRVGRAVVFSTVALVLGFSSLCFSEFVPTVYFGALVGATMLGGLFGNLVVLPVLLHLFFRGKVNGSVTESD